MRKELKEIVREYAKLEKVLDEVEDAFDDLVILELEEISKPAARAIKKLIELGI